MLKILTDFHMVYDCFQSLSEIDYKVTECQERCQNSEECNFFLMGWVSCRLLSSTGGQTVNPNYEHKWAIGPKFCPIHGGWSEFEEWKSCNATCMTSRSRNCTNPTPEHEGNECEGQSEESKFCTDCPGCFVLDRYKPNWETEHFNPAEVNYSPLECQSKCQENSNCAGFSADLEGKSVCFVI